MLQRACWELERPNILPFGSRDAGQLSGGTWLTSTHSPSMEGLLILQPGLQNKCLKKKPPRTRLSCCLLLCCSTSSLSSNCCCMRFLVKSISRMARSYFRRHSPPGHTEVWGQGGEGRREQTKGEEQSIILCGRRPPVPGKGERERERGEGMLGLELLALFLPSSGLQLDSP